ncbi:putative capsid scaffold protein [Vibrio phage 137E35-1]|nr:putative capsid scaffold protein [Vibrio phage 137E35-1]CAH9015419.1 putative capsid scaffold protein [Vibrio phage 230E39-1]
MADLTKEQYEQLPEFIRDDYKEVDGVYKHAGMLKVKQTANELDNKFKAKDKEYQDLNERLTAFEQGQKQAIDDARAEALEEAKSSNDVAKIEALHKEQMADLEKRVEKRTREAVKTETAQAQAQEKANTTAQRIAAKYAVDADAEALLLQSINSLVKPDEQGNVIFYNEDGTASSLDEAGFAQFVETSPKYKRLRKAVPPTQGGGFANGSGHGSGRTAGETNEAAENARKSGDLGGYLKAAIKL